MQAVRVALTLVVACICTTVVVSSTTSHSASPTSVVLGPPTYTAGPLRGVWDEGYYNNPTATAAEPQPKVSDPVTGKIYSLNLTSPTEFPHNNTVDPVYLPVSPPASRLHDIFVAQISSIVDASPSTYGGKCGQCIAGLQVGQAVALTRPELVVDVMLELCTKYKFTSNCYDTYANTSYGGVITQVLANADVGGYDGQMICNSFVASSCPLPPPSPLNMTTWFKSPKPSNIAAPQPKVGGKRLKVLHMSDFHLDARYEVSAEANCTGAGSLCCRHGTFNPSSPSQILLPAPRYGAFTCDTPFDLALAALESIPVLTNTQDKKNGFAWTIYTGDLVSHDPNQQLGQALVEYTETLVYDLFHKTLNSGPIYAALGNHDSSPQSQEVGLLPNTPSTRLANQFSWNYKHVSRLWEYEGWINKVAGNVARAHYGGYSIRREGGLKIITLNTDFWYKPNYFNYIGAETSDPGGNLRFLTDELQASEDIGERVWVIGHVLTGWDGSNPLQNPTNLFYQIVDRFSPHVIAAMFFGHTHEDQFMVYYANNATTISEQTAQTVGWIGPSISPGTNLNSGFRMYEVDAETFEIMDAHTWYANVSSFHELDSQIAHGPTFVYEYSSREEYGTNITWPTNAPLNATWWHRITEQMEIEPSLVQTFTTHQGKRSVKSPPCITDECVAAKICYMRSGSVPIARQNCVSGYGSVQS